MLLLYIFIIFSTLFSLNFFIKTFFKNEKCSFFSALFSSCFLLVLFLQLIHKVDKLTIYTIIPIYLILHLIICLIFSTSIFYILMIPQIALAEYFRIIEFFKFNISFQTKVPSFISVLICKFNHFFNPLYNLEPSEFSQNKTIKSIFLLSYLISGMLVLSPITNSLSKQGLDTTLDSFKRDYDLYKNVFVTSLIPVTLSYFSKIGGKK